MQSIETAHVFQPHSMGEGSGGEAEGEGGASGMSVESEKRYGHNNKKTSEVNPNYLSDNRVDSD